MGSYREYIGIYGSKDAHSPLCAKSCYWYWNTGEDFGWKVVRKTSGVVPNCRVMWFQDCSSCQFIFSVLRIPESSGQCALDNTRSAELNQKPTEATSQRENETAWHLKMQGQPERKAACSGGASEGSQEGLCSALLHTMCWSHVEVSGLYVSLCLTTVEHISH